MSALSVPAARLSASAARVGFPTFGRAAKTATDTGADTVTRTGAPVRPNKSATSKCLETVAILGSVVAAAAIAIPLLVVGLAIVAVVKTVKGLWNLVFGRKKADAAAPAPTPPPPATA